MAEVSDSNATKPEITTANSADIENVNKTSLAEKSLPSTNGAENKNSVVDKRPPNERAEENEKKIATQIEFYLSDFNLRGDKFFRDIVEGNDGWVPVDTFMKCNRVKKITTNPSDVMPALRKFAADLELDETGMKIRRKKLFSGTDDETSQADRDSRTVHVKRFMKKDSIDAIQEYLRKFGPIEGLTLNKFTDGDAKVRGKWKGSVYVVFKNKEDADKFVSASEDETKFNNEAMIREFKKAHDEDQAKRLSDKKESIEKSKVPGTVLHISSSKAIDFLKIREFFEQRQPLEYVDHQKGQREARVRFKQPVAKEVLENLLTENKGKIVIDGMNYKGRVWMEKKKRPTLILIGILT